MSDKTGGKITRQLELDYDIWNPSTETPRVHGRLTRNNTPGILPTFEGSKQKESLATSEGKKQRKKEKV